MSVTDNSAIPALEDRPAKPTNEGKLLISEAAELLGPIKNSVRRSESNVFRKRCTGARLFREEPKRYRLIASMRREGLSIRQTCRAAHCDARTVVSVEEMDNEAAPAAKKRLTSISARIARMSAERIEEEIHKMPVNLLGMTYGIMVDKFINLIGDPQQIKVEHQHTHSIGNVFDRMSELSERIEKVVSARIIESTPIQISDVQSV